MSGNRTKKLRQAFEMRHGFEYRDRDTSIYKHNWRKFKKGLKSK